MDGVHHSQAQQRTGNILVWKDDQDEVGKATGEVGRQGLQLHPSSSSASSSSSSSSTSLYSAQVIIPSALNARASPIPLSENVSFNPNTPSKPTTTAAAAAAAARKQKNNFTVVYTPNSTKLASKSTSVQKKAFREQKSAKRGMRSATKKKKHLDKRPAPEHVQISNQQTPGRKKKEKSSDEAMSNTPKIATTSDKTSNKGSRSTAKSQQKKPGTDEIDFKIGDLSDRLSSLKKELNSVALRSTRKKSPVPRNTKSAKLSVEPFKRFSASEPTEKTPTQPTATVQEKSTSPSPVQSSEHAETVHVRDPDAVIAGVIRDIDSLTTSSSKWSSAPATPKEGTTGTSSISLHATKCVPRTADLKMRPATTPNTSAVNSAVGAALDAALEQSTKFSVSSNLTGKILHQNDVVSPATVEHSNEFSTSLKPTLPTHSTRSVQRDQGNENINGVLTMDAMRANLKHWNETIKASKAAIEASRGTSQMNDAEGASTTQFPIKQPAGKPVLRTAKASAQTNQNKSATFSATVNSSQKLESAGAGRETATDNRSGPSATRTSTRQSSTPLPTWKHRRIRAVTLQQLQAKSAENSSRLQRSINDLLLVLVAAGATTIDLNLPSLGKASLLQPASGWKAHPDNNKTQPQTRKETQQKCPHPHVSNALVVVEPGTCDASTTRGSTTMADAFLIHSTAIKTLLGEAVAKSQSILQHLRSRRRSWNLSFLDKMPTMFGDGDIDEVSRAARRRICVPTVQSSAFAPLSIATSDSSSSLGSTQRYPKPVQGLIACQGCAALVDPDDSNCRACQTPISITLKWQAVATGI